MKWLSRLNIDPNLFIENIPILNPLKRTQYVSYWKEQKKYCVEGKWVNGVWMPGPLYFYINFCHIKIMPIVGGKTKILGKPFLRDIEWYKFRVYEWVRGFSGFEEDTSYTCYYGAEETKSIWKNKETGELCSFGKEETHYKLKYLHPMEYLNKVRRKNLGRAEYKNPNKNNVDIEGRGGGKSYVAASLAVHNFLFDGARRMTDFEKPISSETLIAAIHTDYVKDLANKMRVIIENLPGSVQTNAGFYPSPFSKMYSGTFSGKKIEAKYKKKVGGTWKEMGSGSIIHFRSFQDNPFASNGTRPNLFLYDEIGFAYNLVESFGQIKECMQDGANKFGSFWGMGTGGDMDAGSTHAVKDIFYSPASYDCVEFENEFENDNGSIGMFIPAYLTVNQYKDSKGNTNIEASIKYFNERREKLKKQSSKQPYLDELQQQPLKPSDAFLTNNTNIFPVAELREQLAFLESTKDDAFKGINGEVLVNHNGMVYFKPNEDLIPADYPVKKGKQPEGCLTIWGKVPENPVFGEYIAALDPYSQDSAMESVSMGSMLVYKTISFDGEMSNYIAAEYTGRPDTLDTFNRNVLNICKLFNCPLMIENMFSNTIAFFRKENALGYLAKTPILFKATANSKVNRTYGLHMNKDIREEAEIYLRDWLNTTRDGESNKKNLHTIMSKPLLKELIFYNEKGNFDRVDALLHLNGFRLERIKSKIREAKKQERDKFFTRKLYIR